MYASIRMIDSSNANAIVGRRKLVRRALQDSNRTHTHTATQWNARQYIPLDQSTSEAFLAMARSHKGAVEHKVEQPCLLLLLPRRRRRRLLCNQ